MTTPASAAQQLVDSLLGDRLPVDIARLYSQSTRIRNGQTGLQYWTEETTSGHLKNAVALIELGLAERGRTGTAWQTYLLRAAEILEFMIPLEDLGMQNRIRLLASATYQLAGYPARSKGMYADAGQASIERLLPAFLAGNYFEVQRLVNQHWTDHSRSQAPFESPSTPETFNEQLHELLLSEINGALGVIAATFRWGDDGRVSFAIDKLLDAAAVLRSCDDVYFWLLIRLTAEAARESTQHSMRSAVALLFEATSEIGQVAFERYCRSSFLHNRAVAWPSQRVGLEKLALDQSFVLCTPTGSGKTTVAECGILRSLFPSLTTVAAGTAPLILYLVPSRALAAEVERRLARVLRPLADTSIVVTGLYGGIDWGPSDAWLSSTDPTVLICTPEKAEALVRFMGPLVLQRLSLVILDEAHSIKFDGNVDELTKGDSRALRLETLMSRLLAGSHTSTLRVIGLSAVAGSLESPMAKWITGNSEAEPVRLSYRSTRQLIGRMEIDAQLRFRTTYDLLDRESLQFSGGRAGEAPFVANAVPPLPTVAGFTGPEVRLRLASLWAALHLTGMQSDTPKTVLISVAQRIDDYATTFLTLLDETWSDVSIPRAFRPPTEGEAEARWRAAIAACADYFGVNSNQYRLLQHGIVMHHGSMPGTIGKLLVELIDSRIVHIVLATSTLSDGVNLPFETIIVPSLFRGQVPITSTEFANLAGRAGRPGFAAEGQCLVLLWHDYSRAKNQYLRIIGHLTRRSTDAPVALRNSSASPLASLIRELFHLWSSVANSRAEDEFVDWLESTAPVDADGHYVATLGDSLAAVEALDTLDGVLLPAIAELEAVSAGGVSPQSLETKLQQIWQRCFAHVAAEDALSLGRFFTTRGASLLRVYDDPVERGTIYRTGLSPGPGRVLLKLLAPVREHLQIGSQYETFAPEEKFAFIEELVALVRQHPTFSVPDRNAATPWRDVLKWWLAPSLATNQPSVNNISRWYEFVARAFVFRVGWGLGAITGALLNADDAAMEPIELDDWEDTGLPWIGCWVKELLQWGTLDPVCSYLLSKQIATTRPEAERLALTYYSDSSTLANQLPRNMLDPRRIRDWTNIRFVERAPESRTDTYPLIPVDLVRNFSDPQLRRSWRVFPVTKQNNVHWTDPAGYVLAVSSNHHFSCVPHREHLDYLLYPEANVVRCERYL